MDMDSESDPYVVLTVDGMLRKKTTTVKNNNNPDWSEPFDFNVQYPVRSVLRAEVYDWDRWTTHDPLAGSRSRSSTSRCPTVLWCAITPSAQRRGAARSGCR